MAGIMGMVGYDIPMGVNIEEIGRRGLWRGRAGSLIRRVNWSMRAHGTEINSAAMADSTTQSNRCSNCPSTIGI